MNVLRTSSTMGEEPNVISDGILLTGSDRTSISPTGMAVANPKCSYAVVDNFWTQSTSVSRCGTQTGIAPWFTADDSAGLLSCLSIRTVSEMARQNDTDFLTMDDEVTVLHETADGESRTLSNASTCSDVLVGSRPPAKRIRVVRDKATVLMRLDKPTPTDSSPQTWTQRVHLGEVGRQRLKSLLSATVKYDTTVRERIAKIGKVKLASIPQLLQMAEVCGLWDEVVKISQS